MLPSKQVRKSSHFHSSRPNNGVPTQCVGDIEMYSYPFTGKSRQLPVVLSIETPLLSQSTPPQEIDDDMRSYLSRAATSIGHRPVSEVSQDEAEQSTMMGNIPRRPYVASRTPPQEIDDDMRSYLSRAATSIGHRPVTPVREVSQDEAEQSTMMGGRNVPRGGRPYFVSRMPPQEDLNIFPVSEEWGRPPNRTLNAPERTIRERSRVPLSPRSPWNWRYWVGIGLLVLSLGAAIVYIFTQYSNIQSSRLSTSAPNVDDDYPDPLSLGDLSSSQSVLTTTGLPCKTYPTLPQLFGFFDQKLRRTGEEITPPEGGFPRSYISGGFYNSVGVNPIMISFNPNKERAEIEFQVSYASSYGYNSGDAFCDSMRGIVDFVRLGKQLDPPMEAAPPPVISLGRSKDESYVAFIAANSLEEAQKVPGKILQSVVSYFTTRPPQCLGQGI